MNDWLQTESGWALGCSAWLGDLGWLWWKLRILECIMLLECFVLYQGVRILVENYREKKKGDGKSDNPPRQDNQFVRLALHLCRRCGLALGDKKANPVRSDEILPAVRLNRGMSKKLMKLPWVGRIQNPVKSLLMWSVRNLQRCFAHKRVKSPNESSSETPPL
jgi:hypothetical protein